MAKGMILIVLLLSSCNATYHVKRAKLHILKAEAKGGTWDDLKTVKETVYVPGQKAIFNFSMPTDTVTEFITKDSVRLRIMRITPVVDTAGIMEMFKAEIECPPEKIKTVVEYKTLEVPKKQFPWMWLFIAVTALALTGAIWKLK